MTTIREQRRHLTILLEENPSLQPYLSEAIEISYVLRTDLVVRETPLDDNDFPKACLYALEQILCDRFLPQ